MRRLPFIALAALAVASSACEGAAGTGVVRAAFKENNCKPGTDRDLANYEYRAQYLATERFSGILQIYIQKYRVDVEETDSLVIRFSVDELLRDGTLAIKDEQIVRADSNSPIVIRTSTLSGDANASLSLFGTCPEFPTHFGTGLLKFEEFTLALEPMDTGTNELLVGTLTATLTRNNAREPVGTMEAIFDFAPPRRPLTDFK